MCKSRMGKRVKGARTKGLKCGICGWQLKFFFPSLLCIYYTVPTERNGMSNTPKRQAETDVTSTALTRSRPWRTSRKSCRRWWAPRSASWNCCAAPSFRWEQRRVSKKRGNLFRKKILSFLSISNFQKKPVALLAVHVTLYWQEEDWQEAHFAKICDVAFTVKCYCECDVAKSLRNGPRVISFKPRKPKVRVELRIIFYRLIFKMACV